MGKGLAQRSRGGKNLEIVIVVFTTVGISSMM